MRPSITRPEVPFCARSGIMRGWLKAPDFSDDEMRGSKRSRTTLWTRTSTSRRCSAGTSSPCPRDRRRRTCDGGGGPHRRPIRAGSRSRIDGWQRFSTKAGSGWWWWYRLPADEEAQRLWRRTATSGTTRTDVPGPQQTQLTRRSVDRSVPAAALEVDYLLWRLQIQARIKHDALLLASPRVGDCNSLETTGRRARGEATFNDELNFAARTLRTNYDIRDTLKPSRSSP